MNITDVRIKQVKNSLGRVKALVSITIDDCFVVHDIKVINREEDFFVSMPTKRTLSGEFMDIVHPINSKTREYLNKTVLTEYYRVLREKAQKEGLEEKVPAVESPETPVVDVQEEGEIEKGEQVE